MKGTCRKLIRLKLGTKPSKMLVEGQIIGNTLQKSNILIICIQFHRYNHAPGTFHRNVIKENNQTISALRSSLELI